MKKPGPFFRSPVRVGTKHGTEVWFGLADTHRIRNLFPDEILRPAVEAVNWKIVSPRILHQFWNDGVVTLVPVRSVKLLSPINFHPVLKAV